MRARCGGGWVSSFELIRSTGKTQRNKQPTVAKIQQNGVSVFFLWKGFTNGWKQICDNQHQIPCGQVVQRLRQQHHNLRTCQVHSTGYGTCCCQRLVMWHMSRTALYSDQKMLPTCSKVEPKQPQNLPRGHPRKLWVPSASLRLIRTTLLEVLAPNLMTVTTPDSTTCESDVSSWQTISDLEKHAL